MCVSMKIYDPYRYICSSVSYSRLLSKVFYGCSFEITNFNQDQVVCEASRNSWYFESETMLIYWSNKELIIFEKFISAIKFSRYMYYILLLLNGLIANEWTLISWHVIINFENHYRDKCNDISLWERKKRWGSVCLSSNFNQVCAMEKNFSINEHKSPFLLK